MGFSGRIRNVVQEAASILNGDDLPVTDSGSYYGGDVTLGDQLQNAGSQLAQIANIIKQSDTDLLFAISPIAASDIDVTVESAAENVEVTRCGKNLFDINSEATPTNCTYTIDGNIITVVETVKSYANIQFKERLFYPRSGDVFTLSFTAQRSIGNATPASAVGLYNVADASLAQVLLDAGTAAQNKSVTYTSNGTPFYVRLYPFGGSAGDLETIVYSNIQLELASSKTTYESYSGDVYDIAISGGTGSTSIPANSGTNYVLSHSTDEITIAYSDNLVIAGTVLANDVNPVNSNAVITYAQTVMDNPSYMPYTENLDVMAKDGLDDYYVDIITGVNGDLRFSFFTDSHDADDDNFHKMRAYKHFMAYNICDLNILGGDIVMQGATAAVTIERLGKALNEFNASKVPLLFAKGNHDTSNLTAPSAEYVTDDQFYDMAIREIADITHDTTNAKSTYYYMDFTSKKIRVIVLDTTDISLVDSGVALDLIQNYPGVSPTQVNWLAEQALDLTDKTDWSVIIASHSQLDPTLGTIYGGFAIKAVLDGFTAGASAAYSYDYTFAAEHALKSIEDRFSYTVTKDFTVQGACELLFCINGHAHYDYVREYSYGRGIFVASVDPAYPGADPPVGGIEQTRTEGTLTAHAFDTVSVDNTNKIVYCYRFGAGGDRTVHLTAEPVSVASSITLVSTLSGGLTWLSTATEKATVSNGVVTGVAAGIASVIATDADGNTENWRVVVS